MQVQDKWVMWRRLYEQLAKAFNGQVSFGNGVKKDNIDGVWVSFTQAIANVDFVLTHNLGRIPVGYIPMTKSVASDVYNGTVAPTKTQITLKVSVAPVTINLFIL